MDTKMLGNMVMFILGFLLIWAALRMGYALTRPALSQISPDAAAAADFVLL